MAGDYSGKHSKQALKDIADDIDGTVSDACQWAYDEGYVDGRQQGEIAGYNRGHDDGYAEGRQKK